MLRLTHYAVLLAPVATAVVPPMSWLSLVHVRPDTITQVMRPYNLADIEESNMPTSSCNSDARTNIPVRCLVARRPIVRGGQIARIPPQYVLTAQRAAQVIETLCRHAQKHVTSDKSHASVPLRGFDDFLHSLTKSGAHYDSNSSSNSAPPYLLASRDGLLLTAALYLLRCPEHEGLVHSVCDTQPELRGLHMWLHTLPPRSPPFSLLLRLHYALAETATTNASSSLSRSESEGTATRLIRRRRSASEALSDGSEDEATLHQRFLLDALHADEQDALVDTQSLTVTSSNSSSSSSSLTVQAKDLEVVPSRELLTNFYRGTPTALTRRQYDTQKGHSGGNGSIAQAALNQLASLQSDVSRHVVRPLCNALYSSSSAVDVSEDEDDVVGEERQRWMHWAHFMLRSRVVNLRWRQHFNTNEEGVELALVPLLDMCNHTTTSTSKGPNITYHVTSEKEVIVNATRAIAANEELVMHYGHLAQRGSLFTGFDLPDDSLSTTDRNSSNSEEEDIEKRRERPGVVNSLRSAQRNTTASDTPAARRSAALAREMRAIERAQRYEMQSDDNNTSSNDGCGMAIEIVSPSLRDAGTTTSMKGDPHSIAQREAAAETRWFWRYGFYRDQSAVLQEASTRWASTLRRRVAQLTDVRRRGRRGEFVLGVPENLAHLRLQRERLERERYHSTRIFPPQQS